MIMMDSSFVITDFAPTEMISDMHLGLMPLINENNVMQYEWGQQSGEQGEMSNPLTSIVCSRKSSIDLSMFLMQDNSLEESRSVVSQSATFSDLPAAYIITGFSNEAAFPVVSPSSMTTTVDSPSSMTTIMDSPSSMTTIMDSPSSMSTIMDSPDLSSSPNDIFPFFTLSPSVLESVPIEYPAQSLSMQSEELPFVPTENPGFLHRSIGEMINEQIHLRYERVCKERRMRRKAILEKKRLDGRISFSQIIRYQQRSETAIKRSRSCGKFACERVK